MANGTVYSGKWGKVEIGASAVNEVTSWTFTETSDVTQYGAFGKSGYKDAVGGNVAGNGSFDAKVDFDVIMYDVLTVGDEVTLKLHLSESTGPIAADEGFTLTVIITDITWTADGDTGDPVSYTCTFVTSGGSWSSGTIS